MKDLRVFYDSVEIARLRVDSISGDANGNITVMETYGLNDRDATLPGLEDGSTTRRQLLAEDFKKLPFNLGEIIEWCSDNTAQLIMEDGANKAPSQVLVGDPTAFTTTTLPAGQETVAYSQVISFTTTTGDGTLTLVSGALPAGLTLTTATIAGTPTTAGTYNFTLRLRDDNYNSLFVDQQFTIVVAA